MPEYDAVIVGAGPNGLAAAVTLAGAGAAVLVLEAASTVGGGTRTAELTLPGYRHDVCAAIHPLGLASPLLRSLPLQEHGLEWLHPTLPVAHPLDEERAAAIDPSLEATAAALGSDGAAYRRLLGGIVDGWPQLEPTVLGPVLRLPAHPLAVARFGRRAVQPATRLARREFDAAPARALFAGLAAHSILPLERPLTAAFGLLLAALAHVVGWPVAKGGSQAVADALASHLRSQGGHIVTGHRVDSLDDLPSAKVVLCDTTPAALVRLAGERLPAGYARRLRRFRHGPGAFKLDLALEAPIPWRAREPALAGTVHVGGTMEEVAEAERAVWRGEHPQRPFVLVAQQSLVDPTRAPPGRHTVWAYCHVPPGSTVDMTAAIEGQIERFAPGFRDRILARHAMGPVDLERYNENYVGGDITGGAHAGWQLLFRPTFGLVPYATPAAGIYLCSASTPPGGGVHGMSGYWAARAALARELR